MQKETEAMQQEIGAKFPWLQKLEVEENANCTEPQVEEPTVGVGDPDCPDGQVLPGTNKSSI